MKIIKYSIIILIGVFVISCSKVTEPVKKIGIGTRVLSYQGDDDKVGSLIIPPDLTTPNAKGIFIDKSKTDDIEIVKRLSKVEVKRDSFRRWLLVDLPPEQVWFSSKEFFRSFGFMIEKENQKIGIFETDYLEKETIVPNKSLGVFRAALAKALKTSYGMPTADKYRVRIEPHDEPNKSEVYLTLSSIGEVVSGEMRLWQPQDKDLELETEMLLTLMVFLGSKESDAINQIEANRETIDIPIQVGEAENGYATLIFPFNRNETWRYLGWALDELSVDVEGRDEVDGSFFIKVTPNKGFFSKLINTVGSANNYQLYIKQIDNSLSEVFFVDLSQENKQATIDYSYEFFNEISIKF